MSTAETPGPPPRRPSLDPASSAIRNAVRALLAEVNASEVGPGTGAPPRIILAVSGGADSMALLHACAFLHRRGECEARAVTVDHGLQTGSAEVARRVLATAESWGVPAEISTVSVDAGTVGLEAAARDVRYAALEAARSRAGARWILTAHTQSDQAETVLLGLMRGSGTRSLAGMAPRTGALLRPLLGLTRAETTASCAAQNITVWDDPMNEDESFARVRTRRLLARLETELGQPITANLSRTAELCRTDADCLDSIAEEDAAELRGHSEIPLERLTALPEAILTRVLRDWLTSLGVPAQSFGAQRIAELSALIRAGKRGRLSLPGDTEVIIAGSRLRFQLAAKAR
ncbi:MULTISPECIES: tRNA lysidine(34) synthetase TilS [unclassified Brevibacterium]|uniref:tRNA lysidine(34) synthetase TilS n=1 Tax=unclassified Brevibacterium TaxID=2614124 RepID=UPI001E419BF1|nr:MULTISPECIES: tRNA lysidine(34) synthetase TilS [unclassified Brevibacterium]MCD1287121.1 tRNA lysidine(34) synthetase TilS [Brevibacterium sp. CCUG 69071]MDK8436350.1 tRNA lysidine(34) synthetase TilS [Brevibacterium sp. H-BE7]